MGKPHPIALRERRERVGSANEVRRRHGPPRGSQGLPRACRRQGRPLPRGGGTCFGAIRGRQPRRPSFPLKSGLRKESANGRSKG